MRASRFLISLRQNADWVHFPQRLWSIELPSSTHCWWKFQYQQHLQSKHSWCVGSGKIMKPTNTVFAALEIHHDATRSVHQTSSYVQVLRQHDLHRKPHPHSSSQWCTPGGKCVTQSQRLHTASTWAPTLSWIILPTGLWASMVWTRAGSLSRASNTRADPENSSK